MNKGKRLKLIGGGSKVLCALSVATVASFCASGAEEANATMRTGISRVTSSLTNMFRSIGDSVNSGVIRAKNTISSTPVTGRNRSSGLKVSSGGKVVTLVDQEGTMRVYPKEPTSVKEKLLWSEGGYGIQRYIGSDGQEHRFAYKTTKTNESQTGVLTGVRLSAPPATTPSTRNVNKIKLAGSGATSTTKVTPSTSSSTTKTTTTSTTSRSSSASSSTKTTSGSGSVTQPSTSITTTTSKSSATPSSGSTTQASSSVTSTTSTPSTVSSSTLSTTSSSSSSAQPSTSVTTTTSSSSSASSSSTSTSTSTTATSSSAGQTTTSSSSSGVKGILKPSSSSSTGVKKSVKFAGDSSSTGGSGEIPSLYEEGSDDAPKALIDMPSASGSSSSSPVSSSPKSISPVSEGGASLDLYSRPDSSSSSSSRRSPRFGGYQPTLETIPEEGSLTSTSSTSSVDRSSSGGTNVTGRLGASSIYSQYLK